MPIFTDWVGVPSNHQLVLRVTTNKPWSPCNKPWSPSALHRFFWSSIWLSLTPNELLWKYFCLFPLNMTPRLDTELTLLIGYRPVFFYGFWQVAFMVTHCLSRQPKTHAHKFTWNIWNNVHYDFGQRGGKFQKFSGHLEFLCRVMLQEHYWV